MGKTTAGLFLRVNQQAVYVGNSPLAGQITFSQNGATKMTTTKTYDYLNRLTVISSSAGASNISSFSYQYNNANQRTKATPVDGSYWVYSYDSLGQVTAGNKYWSDGTPVAGQQFDYTFDTIGNRTQTQEGGDQTGANLRAANYTNNGLNQITSRSVPGDVDIKGLGFATNAVTVNGQAAYRKGEYFRDQVGVTNTSAPIWQNVTVASPGQGSVAGYLFVPQTPEQFSYDADGNLLQDGRWTYVWDGENRLINMTSLTNGPAGSKLKLDFAYDYMGRRIQKIVSTNNGLAYIGQSTNLYLYDGWNPVVELGASGSLIRSYLWGADVSGSLQGAGGVGGLLEMSYYGSSTTNCFVAYDGNGNVSTLVNAANSAPLSFYEYGPFGEVIRGTGPMAKVNPFRFSTKYDDDESDFLYYGYRFYSSSRGTWLSRDPLNELGSVLVQGHKHGHRHRNSEATLYVFCGNHPLTTVDMDGRDINDPPPCNFNINCCNQSTIQQGLQILTKRWRDAAFYLDFNGVGLDPNDVTGVSCLDSANHILAFMSPTPKCWKCYIERRGSWGAPFGGGDENYIRCDDVTSSGYSDLSYVFDWWYETYENYPHYKPIDATKFAFIFPYGPWAQPQAWYTKANPAPYDDCINKAKWPLGPENYATFLDPLVERYGWGPWF